MLTTFFLLTWASKLECCTMDSAAPPFTAKVVLCDIDLAGWPLRLPKVSLVSVILGSVEHLPVQQAWQIHRGWPGAMCPWPQSSRPHSYPGGQLTLPARTLHERRRQWLTLPHSEKHGLNCMRSCSSPFSLKHYSRVSMPTKMHKKCSLKSDMLSEKHTKGTPETQKAN